MGRWMRLRPLLAVTIAVTVFAGCSSGGGREVEIVAGPDDCSPTSISVDSGEALTLVVRNEADGDREIEGIEGTRLEEVLVPSGRTRRIDYTMPSDSTLQKLKCYIPNGPTTVIELSTGD